MVLQGDAVPFFFNFEPMKKIILLLILAAFALNSHAQDNKKTEKEFIEIWVYYSVKDDRIIPNMYVDIGTSKYHSLKGVLTNGEGNTIIFSDGNGTLSVYNNEVDLLKQLSDIGWEVENKDLIELIGRNYIRYTLVKTE